MAKRSRPLNVKKSSPQQKQKEQEQQQEKDRSQPSGLLRHKSSTKDASTTLNPTMASTETMVEAETTNTKKRQRRLWLTPEEQDLSKLGTASTTNNHDDDDNDDDETTYERIFEEFAIRPQPPHQQQQDNTNSNSNSNFHYEYKSWSFFLSNTIVVGQEFVLTCLFLAVHRAAIIEEDRHYYHNTNNSNDGDVVLISQRLLLSLGLIWSTLLISVITNEFATSQQYRIKHRFTDFVLMAILLRFASSVLRTLTVSFSSDTVYALSVLCLFIHVLTCDYAYANGMTYDNHDNDNDNNDEKPLDTDNPQKQQYQQQQPQRPTFQGGTVSLTTVFFATILLASRLRHNITVYIFVCSSVVLFALFPAARHLVAVKAASTATTATAMSVATKSTTTSLLSMWTYISSWIIQSVPLIITLILTAALLVLLDNNDNDDDDATEIRWVCTSLIIICGIVPIWKWYLQRYKVALRGPWDIAHV